jgi:3-oxoacyl-[acyl-carrier-protein] synthase III
MNGERPRWAQISGWGMYVPERVLTNADLERVVDTSDEWIVSRTGIRERHIVSDDRETTATMAVRAARRALRVANLAPSQVDLVIVATTMPDYPFPATACLVQDALGAVRAGAFDLGAACSGFIYALSVASSFIRSGAADHVLVIGSETLSRMADWTDRNTCVLFGDGAGAVVLSASTERSGVLASELGSDGSGGELLIVRAGGSRAPASYNTVSNGGHYLWMNGREVFRFATTIMPKATEAVVRSAGWQLADLDLVIPHQANIRIIESSIKRLGLPPERFFVNVERYGNTSAASIPIALCEAVAQGRVHPGDKLVLVGFGAGLTWAAAAVEWGVPVPIRPRPWWRMVTGFLFGWAGIRSLLRRTTRHVYNWILGPVGKDDWRGRMRQRADRLRKGIGRS